MCLAQRSYTHTRPENLIIIIPCLKHGDAFCWIFRKSIGHSVVAFSYMHLQVAVIRHSITYTRPAVPPPTTILQHSPSASTGFTPRMIGLLVECIIRQSWVEEPSQDTRNVLPLNRRLFRLRNTGECEGDDTEGVQAPWKRHFSLADESAKVDLPGFCL